LTNTSTLATQRLDQLRRGVAIKQLLSTRDDDLDRFEREVRISGAVVILAAAMQHGPSKTGGRSVESAGLDPRRET